MGKRTYRKLKTTGAVAAGIAVAFGLGLLVGAKFIHPAGNFPGNPTAPGGAAAALDRVLPDVDLDDLPLEEAVARLSRVAGVRIDVEWKALQAFQAERQDRVRFRAHNVTLERALASLCWSVWQRPSAVGYFCAGDRLVISAGPGLAARGTFLGAYDVRDLIASVPPMDTSAAGTGGQRTLFGGDFSPTEELGRCLSEFSDEKMRVAGSFAGRLLVEQTWEGHRKTARALELLRATAPAAALLPPERRSDVWEEDGNTSATPPARGAEDGLRRRLAEVHLDSVPLEQAIAKLREASHTPITIDWSAVEEKNISRDVAVTLRMKDVTLAAALRQVLDAAGLRDLTFGPMGDVVEVLRSGSENAGILASTRIYDVSDLLKEAAAAAQQAPNPAAPDGSKRLLDVIYTHVVPDSWKTNGGVDGSIVEWRGRFIVRQSWENHQKLADFLTWLRGAPGRVGAADGSSQAPSGAGPTSRP